MDIVASIIKALFGSKADKDRKQIEPYLEKIKAVYPSIEKLTNDELRAHSEALKKQIADFIAADEARIVELKAILEKPETQLEEKEKISKEIDETTKRIDEKIEEVLDKILPEAFAIMKDTARRFAQNETVVVTGVSLPVRPTWTVMSRRSVVLPPPGGAAISVLSKPPADHSGTSCHNPRTWRLIRTTAEEISRRAVPPSPLTATVPHRPIRKPPRPMR